MRLRLSWIDVKLGLRMLIKYPGLTLIGGFGIAVGVAISTAAFTFFYSHLFPRLPLPDGDRIVALENWHVQVNNEDRRLLHDLVAWRQQLSTITEVGAFRDVSRNLVLPARTVESISVAEITAAGLQAAHVPPLRGRLLLESDERAGAAPVLLIGYDVWQSRFDGREDILGLTINLGDGPRTIVGVMPRGFAFPVSHRYWAALTVNPQAFPRGEGPALFVFGRLAPGVTVDQAQAELSAIGQRAATAFPDTHRHLRPRVQPYTYSIIDIQDIGNPLIALGTAQLFVTLVLLIVCVNVAVLVYARTATRQTELTVRSALGASRTRIVGQLFVEALVLTSVSAVAGLGVAQLGLRLANRLMEEEVGGTPFWMRLGVAPETLLYVAGLTLLSAVVIGVLPAVQATGRRLQSGLRDLGGGTRARLGRTWTTLVIVQVAIAVAALPAVARQAWTIVPEAVTHATFETDDLLGAAFVVTQPGGAMTEAMARDLRSQFARFQTELIDRLAAEPAIAATTMTLTLTERSARLEVEGVATSDGSPGHAVLVGRFAPNFPDVVGVRMLAGEPFPSTAAGSGLAIVNQQFVQRVLGGADAVGRRVRLVNQPATGKVITGPWLEIVGVVSDLKANPFDPTWVQPAIYQPIVPGISTGGLLLMRVRVGDPEAFVPRLREIASAINPSIQLLEAGAYGSLDRQASVAIRLVVLVVGLIFGSVLLLSAAGIYAMMSFTVTQRRREIGIRAALGAEPQQVLRSIFGRAIRQLLLGILIGGAAAALLDQLASGEMLGGDALLLLPPMAAVMMLVGVAATLSPARRALRIQPTGALRQE